MGQTRQERQDKLFTNAMRLRAIHGLLFYSQDLLEQLDQFPQVSAGINRSHLVEFIDEVEKRAL